MTKYKSYGSKGGRFEEKDPGYGSLKELRRRDQTLINASKQNALAIEQRGKEYISAQQRSDAKEIQNKQEIHSFEQKKLDLREKNIRIASKQIVQKGRDEAAHHMKVGKLLSSLSESAGQIAIGVGKAWEKAGDTREEIDSLKIQLDSNEVDEDTVKEVIKAKLQDADTEAEKNKYIRQLDYLDQSSIGVPSQAGLMFNYLGFGRKHTKFNARAERASGGAKLNWEEYQAKNQVDHTSVESYNKAYNAWAEDYLRTNNLWHSAAPKAMELKRQLLKDRNTHNLDQRQKRNEAISLDIENDSLTSIESDPSKENVARQMLTLGSLANKDTNVAYTDAESRDKIFNHYAENPRVTQSAFQELLDQPAGRIENGKWVAHKGGKSWKDTYPKQSEAWENKRTAAINARKNRATAKAEGRDQEGLQKVSKSVFAKPGEEGYEGSLNEAVQNEIAGAPGEILKWFDAAKIEHAANPKTLSYIQQLEWHTLQDKDTATTTQLAKHLHANAESEAGINLKDLNAELTGFAKTAIGIEDINKVSGTAPATLKLAVAETAHRYVEKFNELSKNLPADQAKAQTDQWLQDERKNAETDKSHWLHVTSSNDSDIQGDKAYFTKYLGVTGKAEFKTAEQIKSDHLTNPNLFTQELQHDVKTLLPIVEDLRSGSYVHIPASVRESAEILDIPIQEYVYHQVMIATDGLHTDKKGKQDDKTWAEMGVGPREMTLALNPIGENWVKAVKKAKDLESLQGLSNYGSAINNGVDHLKLSRVGNTVDVGFAHSEHSYPAAVGNRLNAVISWANEQGFEEIKSDQIIPNTELENYDQISILNGKDLIHPKPGSPLNDALDQAVDKNGRRLFRPCYVTDISKPGAYSGRPTCYRRN